MSDLCISCAKTVSRRQHGITCDRCGGWQHRICGTGITLIQYRQMAKGLLELEWFCDPCKDRDVVNSTISGETEPPSFAMSPVPMETEQHDLGLGATYILPRSPPVASLMKPDDVDFRQDDARDTDASIRNVTFDIVNRDVVRPVDIHEESLADQPLDDEVPEVRPVTFEEHRNGSQRGSRKLVSSDGFTYSVKRSKLDFTYWVCSVRSKKMTCHAYVKQYGNQFTRSTATHVHPCDPGAAKKLAIAVKVKDVAKEHLFKPAAEIVETVMREELTPTDFCLPSLGNLTRMANYNRQRQRQKDT